MYTTIYSTNYTTSSSIYTIDTTSTWFTTSSTIYIPTSYYTTSSTTSSSIPNTSIPTTYYSTANSTTIGGTTSTVEPHLPPPPTHVDASDGTYNDKIEVTWSAVSSATAYNVYVSQSVSSEQQYLGETANTAVYIEGSTPGAVLYIWIYSVNTFGESATGTYDTGYIATDAEATVPDAPDLTSAQPGNGRATLYFSANGDGGSAITGYTASCGAYQKTGASSPITVTGLTNGTQYSCSVVASNAVGDSAPSNLVSVTPSAPASNQGCDEAEAFIELDNDSLVINVSPTGIDDTVNIQCALDSAVDTGIPTVKLAASTYYISSLMVEQFKGSFEGTTKATTIIEVVDGSINCGAMRDSGHESAAIKFAHGEPRIRFMTIRADMPCSQGRLDTIVHFTGDSAQASNCDNNVIFGAVDRVIIDGTSTDDGAWTAVTTGPEGRLLGGCKDTLLGTFKLNRSTIKNTFAGVVTSMKSGAQVDINFNEFHGNLQAVNLFDSNQNTTITTNKFFGDNTADSSYFGVLATNFSDNPPPSTRMVVHNNDFDISSSFAEHWSYGVSAQFGGDRVISDVSSVVTNNRFNLSGDTTYGLVFADISNVHVSANRFNGSGARAIYVAGDTPVSGWTITANTGLAGFSSANGDAIRLYTNTSSCIVGPGQGASVRDDGVNNTVLPQ